MKYVCSLLLLSACCAVAPAQPARNNIALLATNNFTHRTPGKFVSGGNNGWQVTQTMVPGWGNAMEFRHWFRQNEAGSLTYAATPSTSKFWLPGGGIFTWPVDRHEFDLLWVHKLAISKGARMLTYSMAGMGAIALWGGSGAISSGADRQFPLIAGAGIDIRLSPRLRLRAEAPVEFLRQSTFSDPTYQSNWTVMAGPRVGFVWVLGPRRPGSY